MDPITKLKRLDLSKDSFEANGKTYFIESGLSISRYKDYQILEKEAGFSMDFKGMFGELRAIYDLLNGVKFVEASVKLDNLMTGVSRLQEKEPLLLKMCALFINTADEDRRTITADQISRKVDDWAQEYDVRDFFHLALNTINGFTDIYSGVSQHISEMAGQFKQAKK